MASQLSLTAIVRPPTAQHPFLKTSQLTRYFTPAVITIQSRRKIRINSHARASSNTSHGDDDDMSYLGMWKRAVDRKRKEDEFRKIADNSTSVNGGSEESPEELKRKSDEFKKILDFPKEERNRIQQMQVIDRAAAAIAAARSFLNENSLPRSPKSVEDGTGSPIPPIGRRSNGGYDVRSSYGHKSRTSGSGPPGPDFWSWTPPPGDGSSQSDVNLLKTPKTSGNTNPANTVMEKEWSTDFLAIPFESQLLENLPPFQPFTEMHEPEAPNTSAEAPVLKEGIGAQFPIHAAEAAHALESIEENPSHGINPDGSRWWKETGIERRLDGVVCRWTLNRDVTADAAVEWEEKYWEAADEVGYKELGSEKSGRDATGNIWHEYWKETMWQERGLVIIEKTADKWGKNGKGDEWQEKWWEQYDASGKADKWAHKWCSLDPNTAIQVGHAHVWHERWGEKYDGLGGSIKYTDKWAERCEGDAWVKWGDKWDENFDLNGHGMKQGETWWEGKHGECWNRTWGEQHNGSGWVHKYGKSSDGEHWDTHVQEDTWYEKYPHYGFVHCFQNSVQLREVQKPSEEL